MKTSPLDPLDGRLVLPGRANAPDTREHLNPA
jgi:hypothetical protein